LKEGDICNLDVTVYYDGHHGDLNETYFVGEVDAATKHLVQTSYESLFKGIELVKPKELYRNIGSAVSKHCSQNGCAVVRTYTGHGINSLFHTAPNVPHYAKNKAVGIMHPGQAFTD
jgi:methionyl aminopeptidase